MTNNVYWISAAPPHRISIVARPRGNDWLKDDLKRLLGRTLECLFAGGSGLRKSRGALQPVHPRGAMGAGLKSPDRRGKRKPLITALGNLFAVPGSMA
jgi:hypothetical protein